MRSTAVVFGLAIGLVVLALVIGRAPPVPLGTPVDPYAIDPVQPVSEPLPAEPNPPPLPEPATPPEPVVGLPHRAHAGATVRLEAVLSGSHVLLGSDGSVHVVVDVTVPRSGRTSRRPVDVALVLDRSGSMAGPKLEAAREAARRLVRRLGPDDRVTLIAYGSTVDVLARRVPADAGGRKRLLNSIDGIEDFGGTFLSGAIEAAGRALVGAEGDRVRRIILLSDGEANEGEVSPEGLRRIARRIGGQDVVISSVGVGQDFNEDVMLAIADTSGGRYTYLRGPEGLDEVVEAEVEAASRAVAREVMIALVPQPGVRIAQIYGYPSWTDGDALIVRLPDLAAGDHQRLVARLEAPSHTAGPRAVIRTRITWRSAVDGRGSVSAVDLGHTVTSDTGLFLAGRDLPVHEAAARAGAAATLETATRLYEEGRGRDAQQLMRRRVEEILLENHQLMRSTALEAELQDLGRTRFDAAPAPSSTEGRDLVKSSKARALEMAR